MSPRSGTRSARRPRACGRRGAAGRGTGAIHRLVSRLFAEHGHPTQLTKQVRSGGGDGFYHGLGHGVGLEVHESPSLGLLGQELVAGDGITIEPGSTGTASPACGSKTSSS